MDADHSIDRLVDIPGFRVRTCHFSAEKDPPEVIVELVRQERRFECPCGQVLDRYYDGEEQLVRDLPYGKWKRVWLLFFKCRVECRRCGVKTEVLTWVDPYQRCTNRLKEEVALACRALRSIQDVADAYHLSWDTVKVIDKGALVSLLDPPDFKGVTQIAVDELAIRKRHVYATRVIDLKTKRTLWVSHDRTEESLGEFYRLLGPEGCRKIEAVAMDMHRPYINATKQYCLFAQIVFDRFHVEAAYSRLIDKVRNQEASKQPPEGYQFIKRSRYLLLKNRKNLSFGQRVRLRQLLQVNHRLNVMYILKEDLKHLWDYTYPAAATRWFTDWCHRAISSRIPELKGFVRTLRNHWHGILAHCRYRIHTGVLEGLNNLGKVIKRIAFGFRDMGYFFLKLRAAHLYSGP